MTGSSNDRKSLRAGHRERMRQRLRNHGADNLREDEVLEMLLFHVIPRGDVKELAKDLIRTFGSLERVIFADEKSLLAVPNVGEQTVTLFKLMQKLRSEFMRNDIVENNILNSWQAAIEYCRSEIGSNQKESFIVLYLNAKNRLINKVALSEGTVDRVTVYPREVVEGAITHKASAVLLAHNHPTGDLTPSKQDIHMTTTIRDALQTVNIQLLDHLIIGRQGHTSFNNLGLI